MGEPKRLMLLRERLGTLIPRYGHILIDCQPSLGLLPLMALAASTHVLVPVECQYLALKGLRELLETVRLARGRLNPRLEILGILATKYHARSKSNQEALRYLRQGAGAALPVFKTVIPRDVKAEEAPSHSKPLILYAPSSRAAKAYSDLAKEVAPSA